MGWERWVSRVSNCEQVLSLVRAHMRVCAGLVDYNFHCFREAMQEVFELRRQMLLGGGAAMLKD